MVATQDLEDGDLLRRFKAEVSQDEPNRGNNTNRNTRSTSVWCLEVATVYGNLPTRVGVFFFFDNICVRLCVLVCTFFLANFGIFSQDKVAALTC